MENKKTIIVLGLLAVVLIVVGSFYVTGFSVKGDDKIEIGAIFILSGAGADEGISTKQGADLAVKEINADGGINGRELMINYQDTPNGDKSSAVSSLYQLKNQGVDIMIGTTWSGAALAVAPIACDNEVLMIAPAIGVKEFEQECDYIFNVWMADEEVSRLLGKRIYDEGHRTLAVIGSQQAWEIVQARSVKESFVEAGGEVVVYELPVADQTDFKTEVLKVKEAGVDAIFVQYTYQDIISKQLKQFDIDVPIYAELVDMNRIENSEGALEGTLATSQVHPTNEFINKFNSEYGKVPNLGADNGYDAVMLIAEAMRETGSTDATILKDYLKTVKSYEGASGNLVFNEDGGVSKEIGFVSVVDGEIVALG
jgi:branched-chain amino acid transport system substrate-binding protein